MTAWNWTQQAKECDEIDGDCKLCTLPRMGLEGLMSFHTRDMQNNDGMHKCNMYNIVKILRATPARVQGETNRGRPLNYTIEPEVVLNYIRQHPGATNNDMSQHFGVSKKAILYRARLLRDRGLITCKDIRTKQIHAYHYYPA